MRFREKGPRTGVYWSRIRSNVCKLDDISIYKHTVTIVRKEKASAIGAPTSREQTRLFAFERTFRNDFTCKNGIFDQKQNRVKANSRQRVTSLHQLNGYTVGFLWLGFKSDRFFSRLPRGLLRNANTEYYLLCVELLVVSHSE